MFISRIAKPDAPLYCYHQYLWSYFDNNAEQRSFVYRVLNDYILLLSRTTPACDHSLVSGNIREGHCYQFDLIATAVRGTYKENGVRKRRQPYLTNEERIEWLARRLDQSAQLKFVTIDHLPKLRFNRNTDQQITLSIFRARGALIVTDRNRFIDRILRGIGTGGAWGCGMLYIPEVMTWKR